MNTEITRRNAIAGMAALGAAGVAASAGRSRAGTASAFNGLLTPDDLGWDGSEYVLPPLPYEYDALESVIDEQTMKIHHDKHHAGYVKGLNAAVGKLNQMAVAGADSSMIQYWQHQLSFNMGGHINHTMFWTGMKPESDGGGGQAKGNLLNALSQDFGSFKNFSKQFQLAATKVEGSGWGWLVYEPLSRRLMITQMQNQQDMMFTGAVPLLGVDVWEHAYYLKYQNRRADYVEAYMRLVDWDEISRRFEAARK